MNERTRLLLRAVNEEQDAHGALALSRLIGLSHPGVEDAFELDVYACTETFPKIKQLGQRAKVTKLRIRQVGIKSEAASFAHFTANRAKIRKLHNGLINRLRAFLQWRCQLQESDFDALIPNWKRGRHLLIEAKTASTGPGGRAQIRQAIGQLFDYRYSHFQGKRIDLAMLLPSKPPSDVELLLRSLKIGLLWFDHRELDGTIKL